MYASNKLRRALWDTLDNLDKIRVYYKKEDKELPKGFAEMYDNLLRDMQWFSSKSC